MNEGGSIGNDKGSYSGRKICHKKGKAGDKIDNQKQEILCTAETQRHLFRLLKKIPVLILQVRKKLNSKEHIVEQDTGYDIPEEQMIHTLSSAKGSKITLPTPLPANPGRDAYNARVATTDWNGL